MVDSEIVYTTRNGLSVCLALVTASNIAIYRSNSMSMHKYIVYRVRMLLSCVFSFSWSMFGWTWLFTVCFYFIFSFTCSEPGRSLSTVFFHMHSPRCCTTSWWRTFRDFLVLSVMQVRLPLLILFDKLVETFHDINIYFLCWTFNLPTTENFSQNTFDAFETFFSSVEILHFYFIYSLGISTLFHDFSANLSMRNNFSDWYNSFC